LNTLDPGRQVRVEIDHPSGRGEDDPRRPFIAGDHQYLGALHPVAEQPYRPRAAARVDFPFPAGMLTSA